MKEISWFKVNNEKSAKQILSIGMLVSIFSTLLFFLFGMKFSAISITSDLGSAYLILPAFIVSISAISMFVPERYSIPGFYLRSTGLLILAGMLIASLHSPLLAVLALADLVSFSIIWKIKSESIQSPLKKLATFSAALLFMYFAGNLIHFIVEPAGYPLTFVPIADVFYLQTSGVPLLMAGGISVFSPYFAAVMSPVSFLIFVVISAMLTENYFSIFRLLKNGNSKAKIQGASYGIISSLSCQCEGGISLLPTMAILIISIAMVPILVESFILLVLTNYFINRYYVKGKGIGAFRKLHGLEKKLPGFILAAILLIGTPIVEITGIYLGLLSDIFFFFGISILMTVSAYFEVMIIGRMLGYSRSPHALILLGTVIISSILMFVWYIPSLTIQAVNSPLVFLIMNITGILSGFGFGITRISTALSTGQLLDEFIALMFGMPPIIVFYLSAISNYLIWPEFGLLQQIEFGIIVWAIILPFMWLTTNISLNDAGRGYQGNLAFSLRKGVSNAE